ncbi:hypothetical protein HPB51_000616 [Rhipicephalus microplus]|uniref:RNase H type-1 domain-containing protein n=1 Tax=Rhipicephalus microplus TaxID=6941 RepID=A0A9J6EQN3_RHIMP|nr:hypothetical protein HPB51_000616 [Rhipicephalus microplus]
MPKLVAAVQKIVSASQKAAAAQAALRQETATVTRQVAVYQEAAEVARQVAAHQETAAVARQLAAHQKTMAAARQVSGQQETTTAARLVVAWPAVVPGLGTATQDSRRSPVATRIARKLEAVQDLVCDLVLQWIPEHVGISSNEAADEFAKIAPGTRVTTAVSTLDVAQLRTLCSVTTRHADPRVVAGQPPRPLPKTGLLREERALLLRLRIGCYGTAERVHRQSERGDPNCRHCPQPKTLCGILFLFFWPCFALP